ncbi:MAG: glycerophosphodiester phosphodiesterase family protein, partial [Bacteroidota bacterium]
MKHHILLSILLLLLIPDFNPALYAQSPAFQGHRGARGHLPENSIPGFEKALELGVSIMEMDVVISQDGQVVLSHEPWFSPKICVDPNGKELEGKPKKDHLIYQMPYETVKTYDCGCKGHPGFAKQKPLSVHKPLLKDVVATVEAKAKALGLPAPQYNIEIKSKKSGDNKKHPAPKAFAKTVLDEIQRLGIQDRTIIQSFDRRPLRELNKIRAVNVGLETEFFDVFLDAPGIVDQKGELDGGLHFV